MGILNYLRFFFADLYNFRKLLFDLAKQDFKNGFLGSYLGLVWSFVQPLVSILVLWFVFQVGFKAAPSASGLPFLLWLIPSMIAWFFFSDALSKATNSMVEYSYLIKKVVFKIKFLPLIKICSALFIHIMLIIIMLAVFLLYRRVPSFYSLQIIYYLFCSIVFLLGLSWITASCNVFTRDVSQIVAVLLQIGFWVTPIFWNIDMLSKKIKFILKLNPVFYFVNGYRESMTTHKVFWGDHFYLTIYFWIFTIMLFFIGGLVFKRTKPHFADVL